MRFGEDIYRFSHILLKMEGALNSPENLQSAILADSTTTLILYVSNPL